MTHRERLTAQCPRLTGALAGAVLMLCVTGVSAAPGMLAQSPVLATPSSKPNVLLVLDDSGSMGWSRSGDTPMTQAKKAAKLLIDTLSNVNVGIGSFYGSGGEVDHPIVDVDKNRAALKKTIDRLRASGGTPLINTMQQMGSYFIGGKGPNSPGTSSLASCAENGQYNGFLTLHPDGAKKNYRVKTVLPYCPRYGRQCLQSPICHYCQKNFIILLTDGYGWGVSSSALRNYAPGCKGRDLCNVAAGLYDIDLRPDIDTFEGKEVKNNVITYTIGFHTSQALLGDTAREGGGLYVEADNEAALTKAFAKISADITAHARGSASKASFNTRSLSTSTHLYLTRFDTQDWSGDLMAVALAKGGTPGATKWSAGALLDTHTKHNTRVVLTYDNKVNFTKASGCKAATSTPSAAGSNPGGVAFRYNQLSPAQKADLETMPKVSASAKATYAFSTHWGASMAREGGIAVDQKTGNVYWADASCHCVKKYDADGKYLKRIGRYGQMYYPRGVAVDSNSNLWVADTWSHRVLKYDESGVLQKTIGRKTSWPGQSGSANGQFKKPWALAIDSSDNVYVADMNNRRVQVFDKDGNYLNKFGSYGNYRKGFYFREPHGIAIDSADNVYVVDYQRHWVKKFKQTRATISDPLAWKYERTWGKQGWTSGTFDYPWGIAIDGADQVYVADRSKHWVQVFDANGKFKSNLGVMKKSGHSKGKFVYPTGVAIKRGDVCSGNTIYVSDDKRISKYLDANAVTLSGSSTAEKLAKARIAYLRGDRSNEGTKGFKFRKRKSVLGDIIHSTAVYVGAPNLKWPDDKTAVFGGGGAGKYSTFGGARKGRKPVVYVGANDGMLHGFDANTGREVLAYMPGNLYSIDAGGGYHHLTDPKYKHRYYLDATPVISDVVIKTPGSKRRWRTVLVGSEGAGGRGLFALDITDPTQFSEARAADLVLWEFNDTHDEHLGFTMSTPTIAALPNGRWAAIFGNGYQDTSADSTAGQASLFIVYLDGGTGGKWVKGKDYLRIDTGVGSISNRNGLSTPNVVDTDNDSIADRVYAGDVQGNLWVFDLSDINQTKWRVAFKGKPLFNGSAKQPITAKPEVIRHPSIKLSIRNKPNVMVYFGTGQYIVAGDNTNMDVQSFYAVWDRGDGDRKPKHLLKQVFLHSTTAGGRITDPTIWKDTGKTYKDDGGGDRYGWYLNLPKGERVVTAARHRTGLIHFNTVTPSDVRPCSAGGTGWMMMLRASSGGPPGGPAFDFNNDDRLTAAGDTVTVTTSIGGKKMKVGYAGQKYAADKGLPTGVSIISERRYTPGSGTDEASKVSSSLLKATSDNRGRISWVQLQPRSVPSPAPGPTIKLKFAPSTSTGGASIRAK